MARKKNKGGRPLKMTPETQAEICKNIALGMSREKSALCAGVSVEILYAHQRTNPQFQQAIGKADADCQKTCLMVIRRASLEDREWRASAFVLERHFPEEWGRIDRHLINVAPTEKSALPPSFVDAIAAALGMTGVLKPLALIAARDHNFQTDEESALPQP
jgi:hypothetical protein